MCQKTHVGTNGQETESLYYENIGIQMIKKTGEGYKVTSESGKNLSRPNLSKAKAIMRLKQVEHFKKKDKKKKGNPHGNPHKKY